MAHACLPRSSRPCGGDTHFANQAAALAAMPDELRERIQDLKVVHSAQIPYASDGVYGEPDKGQRTSHEDRDRRERVLNPATPDGSSPS